MQCQTRSLRLATHLRIKSIQKQYITCIKLNIVHLNKWSFSSLATPQTQSITFTDTTIASPNIPTIPDIAPDETPSRSYNYDYEIRIGPVVSQIPTEKLSQLAEQCSDQCIITKTRQSKALYIQTDNQDDITTFQSLIEEQFLQVLFVFFRISL